MGGPELILPGPGGGQFDRVEPYPQFDIAGAANTAANWAYFVRVRTDRIIVGGGIELFVATTDAAGHIDVGVYDYDPTTYTKIVSSGGVTPGSANTMQRIALPSSFNGAPFDDFVLAFVTDSGTLTIGLKASAHAGALSHNNMVRTKSSAYPLPDTVTVSAMGTTGNAPYLALVP